MLYMGKLFDYFVYAGETVSIKMREVIYYLTMADYQSLIVMFIVNRLR